MNHFPQKIFSQKRIVQPLIALLILIGGAGAAFAINTVSEGYRLTSSVQTVNVHTICRTAKTTSGSNVFAPTKTSAEWSAFVAHKPANVTLGACCSGYSYGGYCFYLGGSSQSCRTVCSSHGGYDDVGSDWASSYTNCATVSLHFSAPGVARSMTDTNASTGCHQAPWLPTQWTYSHSGSDPDLTTWINRLCACNN